MFRVFITRQWTLEPALLDGSSEARNWVESIGRYRSFQNPLNVIDGSTHEGNLVFSIYDEIVRSSVGNESPNIRQLRSGLVYRGQHEFSIV